MIATTQLWELKARMMMAASAAATLVGQDEPLTLDEETYLLVSSALKQLPDDLRVLYAELDVLRGAVTNDYSHMFGTTSKEETDGAVTSSSSMGEVRSDTTQDSSSGVRDIDPTTGGMVRRKRAYRKKNSRSDSSADSVEGGSDTVALEQ